MSGNRPKSTTITPAVERHSPQVPYRCFMERKSFDALWPFWSEVRWKNGRERSEMTEKEKEGEAGSSYFYVMGI